MKNKFFLRIFAVAFSLVLLVSCFVIAPSADTYDDNCTHTWWYLNYIDRKFFNDEFLNCSAMAYIDSPSKQKVVFIYGRDESGNNLFRHFTFNSLTVYLEYTNMDARWDYKKMLLLFDHNGFTDGLTGNGYWASLEVYYLDKEISNIYIYLYDGEDYIGFLDWRSLYGNYNLQLWLNNIYLKNFKTAGSKDAYTLFNEFARVSIVSQPKTYSDGYVTGNEFGYEQGYGDGFDQGSIDGIQQGITEGYNQGYDIGFQDGLDDGYSVGFDDGRMDGIEEGYQDGYDDAKAVFDTTEAWQDMKSLIFAIFDAPFYVISYSLDFDLFGINVAGTLIALISTALIVWILKIIIVKLF